MTFSFLPPSEPEDILASARRLPKSILEVLKFVVPPDDGSMQDPQYVVTLNYFGIQVAAENKNGFVDQLKNGAANKKAKQFLAEALDKRNYADCLGIRVVETGDGDDTLFKLLPPGMRQALKEMPQVEKEIIELKDFLAEQNVRNRLERWSKYLGFESYEHLQAFYKELDQICAINNFSSYKILCVSTRYFDHLMRMRPSLKTLFTPTEFAEHRTWFGNASPFWTDALLHCRQHTDKFWIEPFPIGATWKGMLLMERFDDRIVVHEPIGSTYNHGASMDTSIRFWELRPDILKKIEAIALRRLGPGVVDMTAITANVEVQ